MKRQRGIALLTALLAVALAVVLVSALLDRGAQARMRTAHALRSEQSWQLLHGLEAWAMRMLQEEQAQQPGVDSNRDLWAQPLPPIDVPGGRVGGSMRELGGCLNLNGLGEGNPRHAVAQERLRNLLRALRLDENIAAAVRDWIDADGDPSTGGAEDAQYRAASPPYRTANRPMAHVSELRLLRGVDADAYATLRAHVCALPDPGVPINLNTASAALWMSLSPDISEGMARRLWRDGNARYADLDQVRQEVNRELGRAEDAALPFLSDGTVSVDSRYFVMEADILADGLPFLYSSLIERGEHDSRVLARVRGRW